ncbi:hypothetical protein HK104_008603 [Borealophlyctis nickersoniae]|nr:hypothetical protein HK104_008603 [Borealophlyctis nickersoniae]
MKKSAADYILRVRAGTGYEPENLKIVNVNDEHNPILIDSEHFTGYLVVRVLNFSGITPNGEQPIPNPASNYFHGRNRRYSVMIQGRFKKAWNGDDLIFGADFDTKVRVPTGVGLALKIAKWLDPALDADLYCEKPWLYTPLVSAMNALAVFPPDAPEVRDALSTHHHHHGAGSPQPVKANRVSPASPRPTSAKTLSEDPHSTNNSDATSPTITKRPAAATTPEIGIWSFHSRPVPENTSLLFPSPETAPALTAYEKRKKHFADAAVRSSLTLSPDHIFCMDFYDAYFDFNKVELKLPGFSVNAFKYWDGQPLRFVGRSRDGKAVFFVISFELLERGSVECGTADVPVRRRSSAAAKEKGFVAEGPTETEETETESESESEEEEFHDGIEDAP